ncbi:MAG: T9SS type A sorting domain-containing protein [Calditrichaeota bacterium]|nr:T9SS type A sorting domain-containing protein [Calditrichota bacterium]
MLKCKVFTVFALCLALVLTVAFTADAKIMPDPITGELAIKAPASKRAYTPQRDEDDFWTYRFSYSSDGGQSWADLVGVGDLGMYEADGEDYVSVYSGTFEDFGTVVCGDDILHIIAVNNGFGEYNPLEKVNGVYHIGVTSEGEATFNLIAAEGEDQGFIWADAGIDADGNLYAIWWNPVVPDEGDSYGELFASKSTDGGENWADAVLLSNELDAADSYPHMTSNVGEYFYVIYQIPGEDDHFDHYSIMVNAESMEGGDAVSTGASSNRYYSYYIGAVDVVNQDVDAGYVYFATLKDYNVDTYIGSTQSGSNEWTVLSVPGASRYPSIGLDIDNSLPYLFTNVGPPSLPEEGDTTHFAWYSFDENGYGGGLWIEPTEYLLVDYPGEVLYVAGGAWTTEGVLVGGCNVWSYGPGFSTFTPYGYALSTSDDGGETWSEMQHLWDIWDTGLQGGYLSHNQLLTGPNNSVWVVNGSRYGYTDIIPPEIATTALSSVMLGEDKVLTVEVNDNVDVYYYEDDELWDVWLDFYKVSDDTMDDGTPRWVAVEGVSYDDLDVDENGIGTYYFHLVDALVYMSDEDTTETNLEPGDVISFLTYCWDGAGNLAMDEDRTWTVNESWTEVTDEAVIPMNFEIGQNYPNPFNNSTVIPFTLDRDANVEISVFDLSGRLVSTVFNGKAVAGQNIVSWNGDGVTTGVYIYTVEANGVRRVGKMTLLR